MYYGSKKVYLSLLGRDSVGKLSILERYINNSYIKDQFFENYSRFNREEKYFHENEFYDSIDFFDDNTNGYDIFLMHYYNFLFSGVLLIYSITKRSSFEIIKDVVQRIETAIKDNEKKPIIYLVGNKIDREIKREVSKEEAIDFCNQYNYKYFECSALTGYNIHEIVSYLIRDITERDLNFIQKNKSKKVNKFKLFNKMKKFAKGNKCLIF